MFFLLINSVPSSPVMILIVSEKGRITSMRLDKGTIPAFPAGFVIIPIVCCEIGSIFFVSIHLRDYTHFYIGLTGLQARKSLP